ncbi:hypothetical protein F4804DRAFT_296559 [Jackrogersella minutella]|nr:hypothetical protein F4804DRAFT_296559 [Jackrogersella minutella]
MSSETQPIDPARFAEALRELPAESLAMKVLELRNAIAHLDYSNAELKPYAEGRTEALEPHSYVGPPDPECADAIAENLVVIARMQDRIEQIRAEVERRGLSWREFQEKPDEDDDNEDEDGEELLHSPADDHAGPNGLTNGVNGRATNGTTDQHPAWSDGTFQTGMMDQLTLNEATAAYSEHLRQLEARAAANEDQEGGMHL